MPVINKHAYMSGSELIHGDDVMLVFFFCYLHGMTFVNALISLYVHVKITK